MLVKALQGFCVMRKSRDQHQDSSSRVQFPDNFGQLLMARQTHRLAVRKANGVYYTPAYIVRFIVQRTLGKICRNRTPGEMAAVRILDPTCGAGAFLVGAYRWLLDWYRNWYVQNEPSKHTAA